MDEFFFTNEVNCVFRIKKKFSLPVERKGVSLNCCAATQYKRCAGCVYIKPERVSLIFHARAANGIYIQNRGALEKIACVWTSSSL